MMLKYGSEAWTARKCDERLFVVNEMKFLRTTAYPELDKMRITDIL